MRYLLHHYFLTFLALILAACSDVPAEPVSKMHDTAGSKRVTADTSVNPTGTVSNISESNYLNSSTFSSFEQIKNNLPGEYTILDSCTGNLNLDRFDDLLVILKKNGEDTTSDVTGHPEKRPLIIFVKRADGTYKLAARSDNTVYCFDCGGVMGDPYQGLVIKNGYFSIEHYGGSGWRWTRTITFKYAAGDSTWYLHKDGGHSYHASDPEKMTTTIRTVKDFGKVHFEAFNIYANEE